MADAGLRLETLGAVYRHLRDGLRQAGSPTAELDARWLTAHAAGLAAQDVSLKADLAISQETAGRALSFLRRRLAGEPVDRILGSRDFWGLTFLLGPDTLSPRPDSETLIAAALDAFGGQPPPRRVLDLGTGSGALLIALLREWPASVGIGVDKSFGAAALARRNAEENGVQGRCLFMAGDWGSALAGPFDLIIANPPYIATSDIAGLARDVRRHDPILALDGGPDGLDAYRRIVRAAADLLQAKGCVILELGLGQEEPVKALAAQAGLAATGPARRDLGGIPRALILRREE